MAGSVQQQSPVTTTYTVAVKTSDVRNAGTDANVYVQFIGEAGTGPQLQLKTSINHRNKFERNHSDVFIFPEQRPLGALKQLKIWHDNSGIGPGWHLHAVEVNDGMARTTYVFPCNHWLDKKEGDKQICRVLNCQRTKQKMPKQLRIAAEQAQAQPQQQQMQQSHDPGKTPHVVPNQQPQYGSPPSPNSAEKEDSKVVPKQAPVFEMYPFGFGYGGYGCYPYYGGYGGYPYYGGYGMGWPGYGYGYGGYPYYGGGYGMGMGLGAFGAGMMLGGFMGHSWSWSFC